MAHSPHYSTLHSVTLDSDAPDVNTPVNHLATHREYGDHLQTYFPTPRPPMALMPEVIDPPGSAPPLDNLYSSNQSFAWETEAVATTQDPGDFHLITSPATPAPYELPKTMPIPPQNLHLIVDNTQRSWERMNTEIKEQNGAIKELTTSLKSENVSQKQFKSLGDQMKENHQELFTLIKTQQKC